jgi:hypothetical protein
MGTDLRRSIFDFDLICVHPWNPWLKQLCPTKKVEELSLRGTDSWRIPRTVLMRELLECG